MLGMGWTMDMSVGVEDLDADHRVVLGLVWRLDQAIRERETFEVVASLLTVIAELTEAHIRREEEVTRRLGQNVDADHAYTHAAFLDWVQRLRDDFRYTRDRERVRTVLPVIRDWWHHHVIDLDMADRALFTANANVVQGILGTSSLAEPILDLAPLHWPDTLVSVDGPHDVEIGIRRAGR